MKYFEKLKELYSINTSLNYSSKYENANGGNLSYRIKDINKIRQNIQKLEELSLPANIEDYIKSLKNTPIFNNTFDEMLVTSGDDTKIGAIIDDIKIGLATVINSHINVIRNSADEVILIGLPEIDAFDELSKVSTELRKSIETPILDSASEGHVKIITAESGSIWLTVSVGTIAAVNLVAAVCWSAAVIRKKWIEVKIFEEQARTLKLKNDTLDSISTAIKTQLTNILNDEAEAIVAKHYSNKDPETIERLKLSLNTMSDLLDRGAKVLPTSSSDKITELFPNYSQLNLIESAIKKISENSTPN